MSSCSHFAGSKTCGVGFAGRKIVGVASFVEKGVGELEDLREEVMKAGGVELFPTGCVGFFVRVVIFVFDESMVRG